MSGAILLALLEGGIKGSITVGVVAALCALLKRSAPSLRASLWLLAILSYPICAVLSLLPVPLAEVGGPLAAAMATAAATLGAAAGIAAASAGAPAAAGSAAGVLARSTPLWPAILLVLWACGFLVGCARLFRATTLLRSRLAGARRLRGTTGLRAVVCAASCLPGVSVRLLEAPECAVPFAGGLFRPTVVLPERLAQAEESELRPILMHELAHARSRDSLARRLAYLASCLFWFVPLPWLAMKRLHEEQEHRCDEAVIAWGVAPPDYARTLVEAMRSAPPALVPGFGAPTRSLERRVRNVLTLPHRRSAAMNRTHRTVAILAAALLAPLSLVRCAGAPATPAEPPATEATAPFSLAWPIVQEKGLITANFGPAMDPFAAGTWYLHKGMDIAWHPGSAIVAAADGEVILVGNDPAADYGNYVVIKHAGSYATRYAHLQTILVQTGRQVARGEKIGSLGKTGMSIGYHLHFELIIDGQVIDPRPHLLDVPAAAGE